MVNKIISTGDGGVRVADSDELAAHMRELRDHGMVPGRRYWHERAGYNYRVTNLQVGRVEVTPLLYPTSIVAPMNRSDL
ncbi:MAG: perosamine synthetase [Rhodospirillaceae bacterium]|nr:perosamine synthetase [Rhodospirillaceae bacterium]